MKISEFKKRVIEKMIEEEGIEVPELGIKIIPEQQLNGKTYGEILKKFDESQIATYEILQKLRNIAFKSNWEKYPFMKQFWVFVQNPDEASKSKGYVARLVADPGRAGLDSGRSPSVSDPGLGVFLYCPIKK